MRILDNTYTISIYQQCINNVNQVCPKRGKKISIALTIHSVDGSLWDFYRVKISIALAIHSLDPIRSLDHSLSARLIPAYMVWCERKQLT